LQNIRRRTDGRRQTEQNFSVSICIIAISAEKQKAGGRSLDEMQVEEPAEKKLDKLHQRQPNEDKTKEEEEEEQEKKTSEGPFDVPFQCLSLHHQY
jgi:hypothetical protein